MVQPSTFLESETSLRSTVDHTIEMGEIFVFNSFSIKDRAAHWEEERDVGWPAVYTTTFKFREIDGVLAVIIIIVSVR